MCSSRRFASRRSRRVVMVDREQVRRTNGLVVDLAHATVHAVGLALVLGLWRFLTSMFDKVYRRFDFELPAMTHDLIGFYYQAAGFWFIAPVVPVVTFYVMRRLRRHDEQTPRAAMFSVSIMLVLLVAATAMTLTLAYPLARSVRHKLSFVHQQSEVVGPLRPDDFAEKETPPLLGATAGFFGATSDCEVERAPPELFTSDTFD